MRLYVNGSEVANVAQATPLTTSVEALQIGADVYGENFQGVLDEIRIYSRALSVSEIQADGNTPVESGVVQLSATKDPSTGFEVLSWADSALSGSYRVRRALGPAPADFSSATCWVVQGTTFTDPTAPAAGVKYHYVVDGRSSCP
jgi:hypothetical protein